MFLCLCANTHACVTLCNSVPSRTFFLLMLCEDIGCVEIYFKGKRERGISDTVDAASIYLSSQRQSLCSRVNASCTMELHCAQLGCLECLACVEVRDWSWYNCLLQKCRQH